jgi:hypothetical protein
MRASNLNYSHACRQEAEKTIARTGERCRCDWSKATSPEALKAMRSCTDPNFVCPVMFKVRMKKKVIVTSSTTKEES